MIWETRRVRRAAARGGSDDRRVTLEDDAGLRDVYTKHAGELYGFAQRCLADSDMAEDAVQETFVRAWRAAGRYDPALASLRTWLYSICRNVVVDMTRARLTRRTQEATGAPPPVSDESLDHILLACQLEEALRRISDDHRRALVETYYRGRPYADVAAELGIPEGTLRSRVYYALKGLRLVLEEMGAADDL